MTAFNTFAWPIGACLTNRTLPDRLADVRNVQDFGAAGTGGNDTAAIQSAINAAAGDGGGIVFIPSGAYGIASALTNNTANTRVSLIGTNKYASRLAATGGGYNVIDQGTGFIDHIENVNTDSIGMSGVNVGLIANCHLGFADLSGSTNVTVRNTDFPGGGTGIYNGTNTTLLQCSWRGYTTGLKLSGSGLFMGGCVTETNDLAFLIGEDRNGNPAALENFMICAHTFERNNTGFKFSLANNGILAGLAMSGTLGRQGEQNSPLTSVSWGGGGGGTVSVVTQSPHGLTGNPALRLNYVTVGGSTLNGYNGDWVTATVTGASTFEYPLAVDPGAADNPSGYWDIMQLRCIYFDSGAVINNLSIYGVICNSDTAIARIDMGSATSLTNVRFDSIKMEAYTRSPAGVTPTPVDWIVPPDASKPFITLTGIVPINMAFPFANLPSSPIEGTEFNINDAVVAGKTWGDAITAGSSTGHILVRRNNSAWTWEGA